MRGSSGKEQDRNQILEQAKKERLARAQRRREIDANALLQTVLRRWIAVNRACENQRCLFDHGTAQFSEIQAQSEDLELVLDSFTLLTRRFLFFVASDLRCRASLRQNAAVDVSSVLTSSEDRNRLIQIAHFLNLFESNQEFLVRYVTAVGDQGSFILLSLLIGQSGIQDLSLESHSNLLKAARQVSNARSKVTCLTNINRELLYLSMRSVLLNTTLGSAVSVEAATVLFEIALSELLLDSANETAVASFACNLLTIRQAVLSESIMKLLIDSDSFIILIRGINRAVRSNGVETVSMLEQLSASQVAQLLHSILSMNPTLQVPQRDVHNLIGCLSWLVHRLEVSQSGVDFMNGVSENEMDISDSPTHSVDWSQLFLSLRPLMEEETVRYLFDSALPLVPDSCSTEVRASTGDPALLAEICSLFLALTQDRKELDTLLLTTLAFSRGSKKTKQQRPLLSRLWYACECENNNSDKSIIDSVDQLVESNSVGLGKRVPIFELFTKSYTHYLFVMNSKEMFAPGAPFTQSEVQGIAKVMKELVFKSVWPASAFGTSRTSDSSAIFGTRLSARNYAARVLTRLYGCNQKVRFSEGENFWIAGGGLLGSEAFTMDCVRAGRLDLNTENSSSHSSAFSSSITAVSATTQAAADLLRLCPFVIPFSVRAKVFGEWIGDEREAANRGVIGGLGSLWVTIRREYVYEDAFSSLNGLHSELKKQVRVKFVDSHGMEEAGIDGGGVFKEFLHDFMSKAFSPSLYGLFKTTEDGRLYPNPSSGVLGANHLDQFEFLGRMLAKALFDGVLVKLPFATFFLNKLLGRNNSFENLSSLDPALYKNLLYVKECPSEMVAELGLDFTVVENEFGEAREIELVRNGRNISVNASNRIEYIHRVANHRLNSQIELQSRAFLRGIKDIIQLKWLRIFDESELQLLIAGKEGKIDVVDLKRHTHYSGGFTENDKVIEHFWKAVSEFTPEQQSELLQFVTSSPRAPLLGFRYLNPGFCIHRADAEGGQDRLPTASTCMNLLKMPPYSTYEQVRAKLLYAIESHAGFDLS
eukprot:CAMPEP_0182447254 /NCGR_PEP_ID=MMETSP1172-20130603/13556_1 /TAXON_ID=708627 /ORGANISM="Timspurckia oligopyrenoides, Strain CCMP3278" /LENGTH=1045 /DNA_ID=CAMNT_0024643631 /DNA_START=152 /DNA_END=3292 /DNA_ORIENTATION=-